jgi:hypothetical protein
MFAIILLKLSAILYHELFDTPVKAASETKTLKRIREILNCLISHRGEPEK